MFASWGRLAYRRRALVLVVGLIGVAFAAGFGIGVFGRLQSAGGFTAPGSQSAAAASLAQHAFGPDAPDVVVLYSSTTMTVADPAYRAGVSETLAASRVAGDRQRQQPPACAECRVHGTERLESGIRHRQSKLSTRLRRLVVGSAAEWVAFHLSGVYERIRGKRLADLVTDPVCHMRVHPATAAATRQHDDVEVYFCSARCARRFESDPSRYLTAASRPGDQR